MKAKVQGKVSKIERVDNYVKLNFNLDGQVSDAPMGAKDCFLEGTLMLKPVVADKLKIGTSISFVIEEVEFNV